MQAHQRRNPGSANPGFRYATSGLRDPAIFHNRHSGAGRNPVKLILPAGRPYSKYESLIRLVPDNIKPAVTLYHHESGQIIRQIMGTVKFTGGDQDTLSCLQQGIFLIGDLDA